MVFCQEVLLLHILVRDGALLYLVIEYLNQSPPDLKMTDRLNIRDLVPAQVEGLCELLESIGEATALHIEVAYLNAFLGLYHLPLFIFLLLDFLDIVELHINHLIVLET